MGSVRTAGYAIGEDRTSPRLEAIAGIRQRPYPRLAPSPCRLPRPVRRVRASLSRRFSPQRPQQAPPLRAPDMHIVLHVTCTPSTTVLPYDDYWHHQHYQHHQPQQEPATRHSASSSAAAAQLVCWQHASRKLVAGTDVSHIKRKIARRPLSTCKTTRPVPDSDDATGAGAASSLLIVQAGCH